MLSELLVQHDIGDSVMVKGASRLLSQIEAGGVGLNVQAASVVILAKSSVDELMRATLARKNRLFDEYARRSDAKESDAAAVAAGCETRDGLTLLYAGISPSAPPANEKPPSRQNIRRRVRTHYSGNAEVSTLRKTLGCLLADQLGTELRRVGTGKRRTFVAGEAALSEWMAQNALVSWIVHPEPWVLEDQLIKSLDLPLNLRGNTHNNFYPTLKAARWAAAARANELEVLANPGRAQR